MKIQIVRVPQGFFSLVFAHFAAANYIRAVYNNWWTIFGFYIEMTAPKGEM